MNLFAVIVFGLFAINVVFGLLIGLNRGRKKAFIRLLTLATAFILTLLLTPLVASMSGRFGVDQTASLFDNTFYVDIINNDYDNLSKIILMFVMPIIFFATFITSWLLSLIVYWILAAIFAKKKRGDLGRKKGRLLGMLLGGVCGFIMFLAVFIPINGYLGLAGKVGEITVDGESIYAELEQEEVAGFSIGIDEYNDSAASKLGFGIDKLCFKTLTTTKVYGRTIVLNDEVDIFISVAQKVSALGDDVFSDPDALEDCVETVFESQIVNVVIDMTIDYALENPEFLDYYIEEDGESQGDISSISKEMVNEVLLELRGNVKEQILACIEVFRLVEELDISVSSMDMETIVALDEDKVGRLVDTLFDVKIVRVMLPYFMVDLNQAMGEMVGNSAVTSRPVLSDQDWVNEKEYIKTVFKDMKVLYDLANLSSDSEASIEEMENYFVRENAQTMGRLMQTLSQSKLLGQTYDAITAFDAQKQEYYFVSMLNDMVFGAIPDDTPVGNRTLRPLFEEYGGEKTGSINAKDNIDFSNFAWTGFFVDISDMFRFVQNVKAMEGKTLSEAKPEEVKELLENLGEMNTEMIQEVLTSIIPEDSNITIPDMQGVDFAQEAEIFEKLYDFQQAYDAKEEGEPITQEQVDDVVLALNDSEFVVQMLENVNTTANVSDEEKQMIQTALDNNEIDQDKAELIKKLFGMNAGEQTDQEED